MQTLGVGSGHDRAHPPPRAHQARALGLVVAVIITSAGVAVLGWSHVAILERPGRRFPDRSRSPPHRCCDSCPALIVPAVSLAFVGLVQGAGISANYPNPDGSYPDASRDFVGQGAANVAAGVFQGMPVGGSVSASSLNKTAGARSRSSLVIASAGDGGRDRRLRRLVGHIAMPALAGLLMLIGFRTIKPADLQSVWSTGAVQKAVLLITFVLTMLIPLQYAVLVGVGVSMILHVVRQSNQVTIMRWQLDAEGNVDRDRPAGDLRGRRRRGPPAVRQPVLRGRADVRGRAARP